MSMPIWLKSQTCPVQKPAIAQTAKTVVVTPAQEPAADTISPPVETPSIEPVETPVCVPELPKREAKQRVRKGKKNSK